ncbi:PH domain-containing protein [Paenibacillus sp. OV219]|uniref:PH domain-containing protein n=1 Tax=Paenibacillus sp. OV219 TaxID=1884377 RepID=UPI0008C6D131|nr:PH domain-containing protein [Paenibacillus sp. OV219]SEM58682.1 hypothetical protein SAMN05518847_101234 [Paenibacillus sp. OV219]
MDKEQQLNPMLIQYWKLRMRLRCGFYELIGISLIVIVAVWVPKYWEITVVVSLLMLALLFVFIWFQTVGAQRKYRIYSYTVTEDEILIRKGSILGRRSSLIPMNRIQHVDIEENLIMRHYGLVELVITTAGGAHSIYGLANDRAEKIRNFIIQKAKIGDSNEYAD